MVALFLVIIVFLGTTVISASALTPSYTVSNSYRSSKYYTALCNVKLTGNQRKDIVNVAKSQLGYKEGGSTSNMNGDGGSNNNYCEYNYWYHNYVNSSMPIGGSSAPWCATFVSWCARQAGVPTSVLNNSTCAGAGANYFNINYYSGSNYTPKEGDLFFTNSWSHVGIVVSANGSTVTTVEGNTNNNGSASGVGVYSLTRNKSNLYFGVPNYKTTSYYSLDLNSYLNGAYRGDISGLATADVYINNKLVANDVTDFYKSYPKGTTYKITDIKVKNSYKYNGLYSGSSSLSGTLNGNRSVNLSFSPKVTSYWLDVNCYLNGTNRDMSGIATVDVYINGNKVANDVTDWYNLYPTGTRYMINDIRTKSGYKYNGLRNGSATLSGTITGTRNVDLSFSTSTSSFSTNFKMKSGAYTDAYSNYNLSSKVGRVYTNDVITITKVYSNSVVQLSCPWNNSGNKTVYCKLTQLKFKATKYINAYSGVNGSKVGRVYPNDIVTVQAIYSSGWMKCSCPWNNNGNKIIYIKTSEIY